MIDDQGDVHFYLNDHLGSARRVIAENGLMQEQYTYWAFGASRAESIAKNQAYRYTGKPFDDNESLDLYYYGARYYDPATGRFLAVDPLRGRNPAWNPFGYTLNNPLKYIDPDGRDVALIIDHSAAWGFGHMYMAVGNDNDGWRFASWEREGGDGPVFNTPGDLTVSPDLYMGTIQDFLNSGEGIGSFSADEALVVETSDEHDIQVLSSIGGLEFNPGIVGHYDLFYRNCGQVAIRLTNSGKSIFEPGLIPNTVFRKNRLKGGKNYKSKAYRKKESEGEKKKKKWHIENARGSRSGKWSTSQNERNGYGTMIEHD